MANNTRTSLRELAAQVGELSSAIASGVATGGMGDNYPPHFCQKMVLEIHLKSKRKWWGIGWEIIFPRNARRRLRN